MPRREEAKSEEAVSVSNAAYWSRTLKSLVGCEVEILWQDRDNVQERTVGVLQALGQNNARVTVSPTSSVDVRYDLIRFVAESWEHSIEDQRRDL